MCHKKLVLRLKIKKKEWQNIRCEEKLNKCIIKYLYNKNTKTDTFITLGHGTDKILDLPRE